MYNKLDEKNEQKSCSVNEPTHLVPLDYPWGSVMMRKKRSFSFITFIYIKWFSLLCKYNKEMRSARDSPLSVVAKTHLFTVL